MSKQLYCQDCGWPILAGERDRSIAAARHKKCPPNPVADHEAAQQIVDDAVASPAPSRKAARFFAEHDYSFQVALYALDIMAARYHKDVGALTEALRIQALNRTA